MTTTKLAQWANASSMALLRGDLSAVAVNLKKAQVQLEAATGGRQTWLDPFVSIARSRAAEPLPEGPRLEELEAENAQLKSNAAAMQTLLKKVAETPSMYHNNVSDLGMEVKRFVDDMEAPSCFIRCDESTLDLLKSFGAKVSDYDHNRGGVDARLSADTLARVAEFPADFIVSAPVDQPSGIVGKGQMPGIDLLPVLEQVTQKYFRLHDVISDCVEGGRITEALLPDDYQAIVHTLVECLDPGAQADEAIKRARSAIASSGDRLPEGVPNIALATEFFNELLDSVETLSGIGELHGDGTLVDLMYLQNAIMTGGYIDNHRDESRVLEIAQALPSGERWAKFISDGPRLDDSSNCTAPSM